ncbi:unnamed protein product [Mytilus coruscus]|uniref:HSPA12A n=1 Tax=Mytilus coruscus TaxID=42192 RepID=A0A6J8F3G0_MYTCO|nr:unnamed protein product [Mytilus coruscus]
MNLLCPLKAANIPIGDCFFLLKGSDKKTPAKTATKISQDDSKTTATSRQRSEKTKASDKTTSAEPSKRPSEKQSPPPRSRSADLSKSNRTSVSCENKQKHKLLVAAIDFGTTYSGYAFLTKDDFETFKADNSKIHCSTWEREGGLSYKAPTFGFDAEKYYHENSGNIDFKEWFFFKHFKMKLYTDKDELTQDTIIEDSREAGSRMKAVDVFAAVIQYFKDHLLKYFDDRNDDKNYFDNNAIHWDLKAKQFMKDAAAKAGISGDQLTLALEPEAASLYCRKVLVSVETTKDGGKAIAAMQNGSKYIVFDQGGGTTDITVHEVNGPNTLKEIHQACGGHYGGNTVNAEFFKFLTTLLSGPVIREIRDLSRKPAITNITTLLSVGGYSESPVLINAIKQKFPNLTVIVPKDPGLAVLKGAVLYGFKPHAITERVSQYTYGVTMQKPYDPDV